MKRWALLVAGLYIATLAVLMIPVCMVAFSETFSKTASAYSEWSCWLWLLVMFVGQIALLVVPVRFESRRPVKRGSLLPTVLAAGFMMALLVAGAALAIYEFAMPSNANWGNREWLYLCGGMALVWFGWSVIFMRLGRTATPEDIVSRQCKALFKGSILELLIAVPTHIAVRQRNECCAGFMTFLGLICGISVMLFSFGPSVFFLFAARWRKSKPPIIGSTAHS